MSLVLTELRPKQPILDRTTRTGSDDPVTTFRVELDAFRGPLDLLLYLVRKHEVDVVDLPIAAVTDQFLAYLDVLQTMDIDRIGEFIEMAGVLIELKSRMVLPHADEVQEPMEDPRKDLVEQLLEYKRFRDAASILEDRFRARQDHFGRLSIERAADPDDLSGEPIHEVELWDLVSAFSRVMREAQGGPKTKIQYDDVPIHVHMERIAKQLNEHGHVSLGELFELGMPKSRLVGLFLAVLELVRHHDVRTEQTNLFGEIFVYPGQQGTVTIDPTVVENYDHAKTPEATAPAEAPTTATLEDTAATEDAVTRVDAPAPEVPAPHDAAAQEATRARKPR
jgi:segregation and condensation protein A